MKIRGPSIFTLVLAPVDLAKLNVEQPRSEHIHVLATIEAREQLRSKAINVQVVSYAELSPFPSMPLAIINGLSRGH